MHTWILWQTIRGMTFSKVFSLCLHFSVCGLRMLSSSLLGHRNLTSEVEKGIHKAILWEGQPASLKNLEVPGQWKSLSHKTRCLDFLFTLTHMYTHNSTLTWTNPHKEKLHLGEDSGLQGQAGFVKQRHGVRTAGTLWRKTGGSSKDLADCGWCRLPICVLGTCPDLRPEIVKGLHEKTSCFNEGHRKEGRGRRREGKIRITDNSELWIFQ